MPLHQAQTLVVDAGLRLVREGMVARTWGNVSVRLDDERFVITPSGIPYEKLTPESIVPVSIRDLSYPGTLKPSSEKGLHAAIYRQRPEINAVIHTHQPVASTFSVVRRDIENLTGEASLVIGPHVRTAAYALPGTKKLAISAAAAIEGSQAALLANHGAVCIGKDMDKAFEVCLVLETLCQSRVDQAVMKAANKKNHEPGMIHRMYLEHISRSQG